MCRFMNRVPEGQIFIAGFMATGKSRIGPILARRLGRAYVDTDDLVQEAVGKTIPEIFEKEGEEAFRKIEQACVTAASKMPNSVIALGGGAIAHEPNWKTIRSTGICICLRATPETIFKRVARSGRRPLLKGLSGEARMAKIRQLLVEREPFYRRADLFVMSTNERTPEETVERIMLSLEKYSEEDREDEERS